MCSNCGTTPEHTKHLVFECSLATQIWRIVFDSFNNQYPTLFHVREPFPIQISADCVLFHQIPNSLPAKAKNDLNEIMLIIKHVLYRFKFRDNLERYPSVRLGTITSALELEKLLAVRKKQMWMGYKPWSNNKGHEEHGWFLTIKKWKTSKTERRLMAGWQMKFQPVSRLTEDIRTTGSRILQKIRNIRSTVKHPRKRQAMWTPNPPPHT